MIQGESAGHPHIINNYEAPAYPVQNVRQGFPLDHADRVTVVDALPEKVAPPFLVDSDNWKRYMRCLISSEVEGIDFSSGQKNKQEQAKRFCKGCIVQPECLMQDTETQKVADWIVATLPAKVRQRLSKPDGHAERATIISRMKNDREYLLSQNDGYWLRTPNR